MEFSRVRLPPELVVKIALKSPRSDPATVGVSLASLLRVSATLRRLLRREEDSLMVGCLPRPVSADARYS